MNTSTGKRRASVAVLAGLLCALALQSARSAAPAYTLHIESQALDTALQEFARQTGMQVLFFSRLTEGRRSRALDGKYSLDAALSALLSQANLTYRIVNARTIEIVAPGEEGRESR